MKFRTNGHLQFAAAPAQLGASVVSITKCIGHRANQVAALIAVLWLSAMLSTLTFADNRKLPKIGELWFQDQQGARLYQQTFQNRLRDLGYVDGKTATFVTRFADGDATKLPALLAELLAQKPDVLWITPRAFPAVKVARTATPMVSVFSDPSAEGMAKSLARPGGNITGMSWQTLESSGKRLQITQELMPKLRRIALLYDLGDPGAGLEARSLRDAAKTLKLLINELGFRNAKELKAAFVAIKHDQPQAIVVVHSALSVHHRSDIVRFASEARLPFISEGRDFADAGALLSFGPSVIDMFKRTANYVDKILKRSEASRPPDRAADGFRTHCQRENSEGTWA